MRSLQDILGCLVDLDGTLVRGGHALPGAAAFLDALDGRYVIVSNNAEHTPLELSRGLRRMGLVVAPRRIVLAGTMALDEIARRRPGRASRCWRAGACVCMRAKGGWSRSPSGPMSSFWGATGTSPIDG